MTSDWPDVVTFVSATIVGVCPPCGQVAKAPGGNTTKADGTRAMPSVTYVTTNPVPLMLTVLPISVIFAAPFVMVTPVSLT